MSRRTEISVGLSILVGIALVVFGTLWLMGVAFGREQMLVRVQFSEVGQLMEGNPVKLRGVPIGRIEDISLAPRGGWVMVTMRVHADVTLPDDPVVILGPESMFGDWQAEVSTRRRHGTFAFSEPAEAGVLPGYSLPEISQLTAVADRIAENMAVLSERVELAFTEETANQIRQAIENIQQVSDGLLGVLSRQERAMDEVASDLETTTETLNQAALAVRRVADQVESAVAEGQLTDIVDNVQRATAQLDELTETLMVISTDFGGTMASADTTFRSVSDLMAGVQAGEGTLGLLLQDTLLYARLTETSDLLQVILRDFQANPRRYIRLELF